MLAGGRCSRRCRWPPPHRRASPPAPAPAPTPPGAPRAPGWHPGCPPTSVLIRWEMGEVAASLDRGQAAVWVRPRSLQPHSAPLSERWQAYKWAAGL
eukprot:6311217-Pyramimonas_sp.AAC.1